MIIPMDLAAHFRVIAQNWLRILLISLGIAILVFAASTVQAKKYSAKELLQVSPGGDTSNGQTQAAGIRVPRGRTSRSTPTRRRSSARPSRTPGWT